MLAPGDANPLAGLTVELAEVRLEFEPGAAREVALTVRGIPIVYDVAKQELVVNGHRAAAPLPVHPRLRSGRQRIVAYVDRTAIEVFASDGLCYVPMPVIPAAERKSLELTATGGAARIVSLDVHELKSAWAKAETRPRE